MREASSDFVTPVDLSVNRWHPSGAMPTLGKPSQDHSTLRGMATRLVTTWGVGMLENRQDRRSYQLLLRGHGTFTLKSGHRTKVKWEVWVVCVGFSKSSADRGSGWSINPSDVNFSHSVRLVVPRYPGPEAMESRVLTNPRDLLFRTPNHEESQP